MPATQPVVFFLSLYVEVLILCEGLMSFPVFELDVQTVFLGSGQLVDDIISQPVLPGWFSKSLDSDTEVREKLF